MSDNKKITHKTEFVGYLKGHNGEVTSLVEGRTTVNDKEISFLVSGSRDKTLMLWDLKPEVDNFLAGKAKKVLKGHNHFISDLTLSADNLFVFSSSWDRSLRLWDLTTCKSIKSFIGHEKEVLSVCFSNDSRILLSCGMDKNICMWNTLGDLQYKIGDNHKEWISKIRMSPSQKNSYVVTVGWDGKLKLWTNVLKLVSSFKCHNGPILALDISQNGQLIATAGKDNRVLIHSAVRIGSVDKEFKMDSNVKDVAFNPIYQWMGVCFENSLRVIDLSSDDNVCIGDFEPRVSESDKNKKVKFTGFTWSNNGKTLYVGCNNGDVQVFEIVTESN